MLRYDFDIVSHAPLAGRTTVQFRDRSTAKAFAKAAPAVRHWLLSAGFVDGISGSVQVPGLYPEADEAGRDAVMAALEHAMPTLDGLAGIFDPREFVAQALRARPEQLAVFPAADWWSEPAAAS